MNGHVAPEAEESKLREAKESEPSKPGQSEPSKPKDSELREARQSKRRKSRESERRIDRLRAAADEAAAYASKGHALFLLVSLYVGGTVGATTHEQLLREELIAAPTLGVALPIVPLYAVMPFLYLLVHLIVLGQLWALSDKLAELEKEIGAIVKGQREQYFPAHPYAEGLIRTHDGGRGWRGAIQVFIMLVTLVVAPVVLLCWMQVRFLPYHDGLITWLHRFCVIGDLVLVCVCCPVIFRPKSPGAGGGKQPWLRGALGSVVVCFTLFLATFPGEWNDLIGPFTEKPLTENSLTENSWTGDSLTEDSLTEKPWTEKWIKKVHSLRTLVLQDKKLVAEEPLPEVVGAEHFKAANQDQDDVWRRYAKGLNLQRRNLRGADFTGATLVKADFRGANLQDAVFNDAELMGAEFGPALAGGGKTRLKGASFIGANLRKAKMVDADLKGAQLHGATLIRADLSNAELDGADLSDATLDGAVLRGAQLDEADLARATLHGASLAYASLVGTNLPITADPGLDLQGAVLVGTNLPGVDLSGADLTEATLNATNLQGVNLSGADLTGATLSTLDLHEVDLSGAHLTGAKLVDTDFSGAILDATDFSAAELHGIDLSGQRLPKSHFSDAELHETNLSGAQLEGADFSGARLYGTDFSYAELEGADFVDARLYGTDFSHAQLEGADFSGAQLYGTNLSYARLEGADFLGAELRWTDVSNAVLEAADLSETQLHAVNLSGARLRGANLAEISLVHSDLRDSELGPLDTEMVKQLRARLTEELPDAKVRQGVLDGLQETLSRAEETEAISFAEFKDNIYDDSKATRDWPEPPLNEVDYDNWLPGYLADLACKDLAVAEGFASRAVREGDKRARAVATALLEKAGDEDCLGVRQLPEDVVRSLKETLEVSREATEGDD